jgi:hypothetical protein
VAGKYGRDANAFSKRGESLAEVKINFGDSAFKLLPPSQDTVVIIFFWDKMEKKSMGERIISLHAIV